MVNKDVCVYIYIYIYKSNQDLVHYLSCQAVTRTVYLNFCSGCTVHTKALASGPTSMTLALRTVASILSLEYLALTT